MATTVSLKPNAVEISGSTSGTTTLQATAVAGTTTLTLPAATDTLVGKATTDTLTNKTLTGAVMNGTLGATTPSTASVTTLTTSSTVTHNGGTANGVAYLNGSKAVTSGSALVFDGTNLSTTGYITATNTSNTTVAAGGFDATTSSSLRVVNASTTAGTGAGIYFVGGGNSESYIGNLYESSGVGALSFQTRVSGTRAERMRIDSSGNLLVGATSFNYTANGVGLRSNAYSYFTATSAAPLLLNLKTTAGTIVSINFDDSGVGSISTSGTVTLYNTTSDQRLKQNIKNAESASDLIDALQVRQFDWKKDNSHQRYGFVAQELVTVAPEAVYAPTDSDEMMAVDYSKLVPMLVKEIQSLRKRITALEGA